jgi:uncharacterized protein (TIGR02611 family)
MTIKHRLKHEWQLLMKSPPGRRFIDRYHRRRHQQSTKVGRALSIFLGAVFLTAGLVMLFVPGPGTLALLVGVALLAEQSQWMARALDWLELKIRPAAQWLMRVWRQQT